MTIKYQLYGQGVALLTGFCMLNSVELPELRPTEVDDWQVGACAYYRPTYIAICLARCAGIGFAGPAWSYPGNTVDRTPYGVLAHEMGHHVDVSRSPDRRGRYMGDFSIATRKASGEPFPIVLLPERWGMVRRNFPRVPDQSRFIALAAPKGLRHTKGLFQACGNAPLA